MKKLIPLIIVALLAVFTVPALAGDGNLVWTADKQIHLDETFSYTETVVFRGVGQFEFTGEAWAKIEEQQELYANTIRYTPDVISGANKGTRIDASYVSGLGVANVNQSAGNLNNQGNEVAISVAQKGVEILPSGAAAGVYQGLFCEAQVVSVQYNGIRFDPTPNNENGPRFAAPNVYSNEYEFLAKADTINNSFNGFVGVANINEAAGDLNNQGNAVAVAAGIVQGTGSTADPKSVTVKAATHVMLAQATAYNQVNDYTSNSTDTISGSFNGPASGVFNANQAAGNLNNQKNAVALSFNAR